MNVLRGTMCGVAPLMFHSQRLANPLHPLTRDLKKLTTLKKKTEEMLIRIKWLEWRAGIYEHDGRVVVPADNVLAVLTEGARQNRQGKDVAAGVITATPHFFLTYDGPDNVAELENNERFCDYRTVVVTRKRTPRARPIFPDWSLDIELHYMPEIVQRSTLVTAMEIAGQRIGMGERRPRNGRFTMKWKK